MRKVGRTRGVCMLKPPFGSLPIAWLATNVLCSNLACQLSVPTACFAGVEEKLAELKNHPYLNRSQGLCGLARAEKVSCGPRQKG